MLVRKVILCYAKSNLSEDKQSEALSERKTLRHDMAHMLWVKVLKKQRTCGISFLMRKTLVVEVNATFVQM